jgi:hypothetical protein
MSSVFDETMEILYMLFQGYCLQYFLNEFLESRWKKEKWNGALVAILYAGMRCALNQVLSSNNRSSIIVAKQAVVLMILFVLVLCFYKAFHAITVFFVITFMALSELSFFLGYMVMQAGIHLFGFWTWCFDRGYVTSADRFELLIEGTGEVLMGILYVVSGLVLFLSLRKIVHGFREKDYRIRKTELYFILAPGMVGLLICILLRMIVITVENEVPRLLFDRYPLLLLIVPAILLLSLLSILYGVKLFQDMIDLNREKNSRMILEKQVDSMQEHMNEMERIDSGIRSMKHDMKNTISVITQLASKNGENTELQTYLSELNQTIGSLEFQFKTGNTVVDTLLNMKYHEAVREMPDLQMDADKLLFPETIQIQSYDIGVILGNALDNAIEACRKLKEKESNAKVFIRLSSYQKGKMVFIEIENSFDGNVIRKKQSEFPVTDKADKEAHGIGLLNMKHTAEKYHGAVDWSVKDNLFTLSVMMKNERS